MNKIPISIVIKNSFFFYWNSNEFKGNIKYWQNSIFFYCNALKSEMEFMLVYQNIERKFEICICTSAKLSRSGINFISVFNSCNVKLSRSLYICLRLQDFHWCSLTTFNAISNFCKAKICHAEFLIWFVSSQISLSNDIALLSNSKYTTISFPKRRVPDQREIIKYQVCKTNISVYPESRIRSLNREIEYEIWETKCPCWFRTI